MQDTKREMASQVTVCSPVLQARLSMQGSIPWLVISPSSLELCSGGVSITGDRHGPLGHTMD